MTGEARLLLCIVDRVDRETPQHWVAPVYVAQRFTGQPTLVEPEKHAEWGWFRLDRLPVSRRIGIDPFATIWN